MVLLTAAAVVDFLVRLEETSASFYINLARVFPDKKDIIEPYAKENKKNSVFVKRVYHEVISDALDGGFSFHMNETDYIFDENVENLNFKETIDKAIAIEKKIGAAYANAAETSRSLMSDLPRLFNRMAQKREKRIEKLNELNDGDV
ncbi:MAG TPA: hypothetical protein HA341_04005 [Halobacteria archaeon]|jgi:hypothetical protein|nr:hypothetical protein [Halobacteria archaeon]